MSNKFLGSWQSGFEAIFLFETRENCECSEKRYCILSKGGIYQDLQAVE